MTNFLARFCVYKSASTLFTGIVFNNHMHVHIYQKKKKKNGTKTTLDYFRKKYPEYANN